MRSNCSTLIVAFIMCLTISSQADVIIKQKSSVETAGIMNIEIDGVEYIKGDKSYSGGTTKMTPFNILEVHVSRGEPPVNYI